jgi:hypothetical protein
MARTIMAVLSNPSSADQEDEYNSWYDEVHLKELLEIPGIVGATRYRLSDAAGPAPTEHRYLALYEVEGDPAAVLAELGARAGSTSMSPALDVAGSRIAFWVLEGGSA